MKGRKRKQAAPDFIKKKRKIGKGKREPANATKVSFKAKSIVVPSQLEKSAKDDEPTSHRDLSLQVREQRYVSFVADPYFGVVMDTSCIFVTRCFMRLTPCKMVADK